jgi:hypothetical protein
LRFCDQHGTLGVTQSTLGGAAEHEALETGTTVAAHDNHLGPSFPCLVGNDPGRVAASDNHRSKTSRLEFLPAHQPLHLLLRLLVLRVFMVDDICGVASYAPAAIIAELESA